MRQIALIFFLLITWNESFAQTNSVLETFLKNRANAFLTVNGLTLTPDVTTGSISISDTKTQNPNLQMTSLGGGGTLSPSFPLYVEGTLALNRYDPSFVNSAGGITQMIPVKWNSVSGTGGIGWDFQLTDNLKFRPMANLSLGHVESDLSILSRLIQYKFGKDFDFLDGGRLNSYGLGGSIMLDYEDYRPEEEIDIELRYTNINLTSFNSNAIVMGNLDAQSISLWARRRVPLGYQFWGMPFRSVTEFSHNEFLGDMRGALGFNSLTSLGAGLELDIEQKAIFFTRVRMMMRYVFGENVQGWSLGFAASF
jgi:hypothetical protein